MARKSHKAMVQALHSELQRSKRWRREEGYDDLWDRMVDLYRGRHYGDLTPDDRVVVNIAFATKNIIAPSISVNNPKFIVEPAKPDSAAQAVIAQEVLNYIWRSNKYRRQFRLAVDDFIIVGHGWLKVGYKFVKEPKPTAEPEFQFDDEGNEVGVDDFDETMDGSSETEMIITDDRPFVERISFRDMYVDPDARNMDEIRWIAQRVRRPAADVRVDKRYNPKVRAKIVGTRVSRYEAQEGRHTMLGVDGSNVPGQGEGGYVDLYEWYDVRRGTMCVFAENCSDGFLIPPKRVEYSFGHPFLMLRNYEVPDEFYPMGDLEAMESLQYELNETRSQMFNHRKRYARKYLYDESAFDSRGVAALDSDKDNTLVPVLGNFDLNKVIVPMPSIPTPPEFYSQSDVIEADINKVTATNEYQRGETPNIRRTATEAAMIQDAANARAADKLAIIEDFLADVGERLIQLMQQFMTEDTVVRIVGLTGMNTRWINLDRDYIKGKFDFTVEGGSTQPRNESFRAQRVMQLVDAMAPFVGAQVVDMGQLAMHVLRELGIKQPERFLVQPPMEMGGEPMVPGDGPPQGPMEPPMGPPQAPPETGIGDADSGGFDPSMMADLLG